MADEEKPPLPPITRQDVLWVAKQSLPLAGCLASPVLLILGVAVTVWAFASRGALRSWLDQLPSHGVNWNWLSSFPFRGSGRHWLTPYLWHPSGWSPVPWALVIPLFLFLVFFLLRRPLAYVLDVLGIVFKDTAELLGKTSSRVRVIFVLSLSVCGLLATVSLFLCFAYTMVASAVYFIVEQQLPGKRRAALRERTIKQLERSIILTPFAMRLASPPSEFEFPDRGVPLIVECSVQNLATRTVTAFSGELEAHDPAGELITSPYGVEHTLPLRPREGRKLDLEFPAYSDLKRLRFEDVKWEWHPLKASFDDGVTLGVERK